MSAVFTKADILAILEAAGEYAARDVIDRVLNGSPTLHTEPLPNADTDMQAARTQAEARIHDTAPAPPPVEPAEL